MVSVLRFLVHAIRLRSFSCAQWVVDYERAERGFHTARFATEKARSPRPAACDLNGEVLKGESKK